MIFSIKEAAKETGLSEYAQMQQAGSSTRNQIMELLKKHREKISADINFLKESRNVLDKKITFYKDLSKNK